MAIVRDSRGPLVGPQRGAGLSICWEDGQLRWGDPVAERYLETHNEEAEALIAEREALIAAEVQSAAKREARIAEQEARTAAEARVRELEAELERYRQS